MKKQNFLKKIVMLILVAGFIWGGLLISSGFAQKSYQQKTTEHDFIERLDQDNDGIVSTDEFSGSEERFNTLDQNGDGYIDDGEKPDERSSDRKGTRRGNHMERLDGDRDGKISQEEFPGPDEHFIKFDKDQDGFLSESELPPGPPKGKRKSGKRLSFEELDDDSNGKISQEEFPGPDDHFIEFDRDQDGFLDESELPERPPKGKGTKIVSVRK